MTKGNRMDGTLKKYGDLLSADRKAVANLGTVMPDGSPQVTPVWFDYDGKGKELLIALSPTRFSWTGTIIDFSTGADGAMNIVLHYVESTERGTRRK